MNDDHDIDKRLRALLEPDGNAVDRLVAAALDRAAAPLRLRPRIMLWALAAAGTFACAAVLLWFNARSPSAQDWLIIDRIGEVVLVQSTTGESWIMGPQRPDDRLPAGIGFVIIEGEKK